MLNVKLPSRIHGKWIWKQSLLRRTDSFLLMRREFVCDSIGLETDLWISANSAYQLFVNGRLVGYGPRAHHCYGTSYIDQHDITFYLESGMNAIAVQVYYNSEFLNSDQRLTPGLWCQAANAQQEILASDESWFIREVNCLGANRARISPEQGLSYYFNAVECPDGWENIDFVRDDKWRHPDSLTPVGDFGTRLELHPLIPAVISDERPEFAPVCRGKIVEQAEWTQVVFTEATGRSGETFAADCYVFREEATEIPVRLYADDPFKLFCNNQLVYSGRCRRGEKGDALKLKAGWNRLLVVQTPGRNSMGLLITFPRAKEGLSVRIYHDMVETAPAVWNVTSPLRLSLVESSPSIHFRRLKLQPWRPTLQNLTDPADLIAESQFVEEPGTAFIRPLTTGDYLLWKLKHMCYGFVRLVLEGNAGDIVDISIGLRRKANGSISMGRGIRRTATLILRRGKTTYLDFLPADCLYVMVAVRKAAQGVKVQNITFFELQRLERHECTFRCSDELLNRFWETGRRTLRRSAAFLPPPESRADYDCYMFDAYLDSVSMAVVFGDFEYIAARLRQFIEAQLENGEIPAITYGPRHETQLFHLFFLPTWIYYNYRFSANQVELERAVPCLDHVREYFESMIDDETGLLTDIIRRFGFSVDLKHGSDEGEASTTLNTLFCRFLLSSAEVYRSVGQTTKAARCGQLAQQIVLRLRGANFDTVNGLFASECAEETEVPLFSLLDNFYALLGGALSLDSFEHFFFAFFNYDPPFDNSEEAAHPYFHFLFMEMMFSIGQREWAFRYFRSYWQRRYCEDAGSWRTRPDSDEPARTRFSDGNCLTPNIFLLREVLGIRIAEPGHSAIYFNPAFNHVDWAEGSVPMVQGRLKVKWEKLTDGSLDVTLDSNVPLKILPEIKHSILQNTTFRLSENITLLNPPNELVEDLEELEEGNGFPEP